MAQKAVVTGLVNKYRELLKEQMELADQLEAVEANMGALETSLRLFDADFPLQQIKPKRRASKAGLKRGELARLVYEFVRDSDAEFTTTAVIDHIIKAKGIKLNGHQTRGRIGVQVVTTLRRMESLGTLEQIGQHDAPRRALIWCSPASDQASTS